MKDEYGRVFPTPKPVPEQTVDNEATVRYWIKEIRRIHGPSVVDTPEFVVGWLNNTCNAARAYDIPTLLRWVREVDAKQEAQT